MIFIDFKCWSSWSSPSPSQNYYLREIKNHTFNVWFLFHFSIENWILLKKGLSENSG